MDSRNVRWKRFGILAGLVLAAMLFVACAQPASGSDGTAAAPTPGAAAADGADRTLAPTTEPTPEPTAAPRFAVGDETVYVLCEGRSDGAKALSRWLRSEGKDAAESFIPDGLDTPMYTIPAAERASEEIPAATDETRHVRVAADAQLLESGVLAAWLPAFEAASGYVAEVYAGDASVLAAAAAAGEADVLLMKKTDASALGTMTHYPLRYELVSTIYSVL